ncbi:uncharacterized protein [Ptychodera flava]|uniref:uncharacterized protein isoform X2 n=1 Tax=Ptychodera flava TaxID=63121 RepID=UPI00396A6E1A
MQRSLQFYSLFLVLGSVISSPISIAKTSDPEILSTPDLYLLSKKLKILHRTTDSAMSTVEQQMINGIQIGGLPPCWINDEMIAKEISHLEVLLVLNSVNPQGLWDLLSQIEYDLSTFKVIFTELRDVYRTSGIYDDIVLDLDRLSISLSIVIAEIRSTLYEYGYWNETPAIYLGDFLVNEEDCQLYAYQLYDVLTKFMFYQHNVRNLAKKF